MNANKITVPQSVANAIAHYVNLADSKHEAFADIMRLGYEATQSEIILRHFDGDYDELMEALICGYDVEKSLEDKEESLLIYFRHLHAHDEYTQCTIDGVRDTLSILGIKIEGINA